MTARALLRHQRSIVICLFAMSWATHASADPITLTFDSRTVNEGSLFDVAIRLDPFDPDPSDADVIDLVGFSLYLAYDPLKVEFSSAKGGAISPLSAFQTSAPSTAIVLGASIPGQDPGVTGLSLLLATLTFKAMGVGDAGILFLLLGDPSIDPVFFTSGDCGFEDCTLPFTLAPGSITIESTTPVPEPATIGLLGLGLLGVMRQLRSKHASPTR